MNGTHPAVARDGLAPIPPCDVTPATLDGKRHAVTDRVTLPGVADHDERLAVVLAQVPCGVATLLRELDARDPGSVMRGIDSIGGVATLLDSSGGPAGASGPPVSDPDSSRRAAVAVVTALADSLRTSRPTDELTYLTLTVPTSSVDACADLRASLAQASAPDALGFQCGLWMNLDTRRGDVQPSHAHGLYVGRRGDAAKLVDAWCAGSGASRDAQRVKLVSGWHLFARKRQRNVLERNLVRIIVYSTRHGVDAVVAGSLESWWDHAGPRLASVMPTPKADDAGKPCGRPGCARTVTGRSTFCSGKCRTAVYRARKRDGSQGDSSPSVTCDGTRGDGSSSVTCPDCFADECECQALATGVPHA